MIPEWTFRTKTWQRAGYAAFEGSASLGSQTTDFFLIVGPQHISVDVQSLRGLTDRLLDLFSTILGKPDGGPMVVNIGELMDSLDEIPMNATWSFPPARREELLTAIDRLLLAESAGGSPVAKEPGE